MRNIAQATPLVATGTLMQKPIPPRLVEPYLTGRRAVIAGFVYRAADTSFTDPADFYAALDLGYDGSEFRPDMTELYVLRWTAAAVEAYQVPYSAERGGDWTGKPPFTGTGYTSWTSRPIPEFFVDLMPIPVGAEIYRIAGGRADIIARYDGQVWLRPAEGI
ncbi:MAG TPA: hypothetical protein VFW16_05100 [Streptosporangiaceae bacterium]|nr:hypothetical protein [Streptosporangiaceae bacterium]